MSEEKNRSFRAVLRKASDPIYDLKRRARVRIAAVWRRRLTGTVFVGITGSHGKSTATHLLARMLATKAATGVGLGKNQTKAIARSILRVRPRRYRYFVQEVAAGEGCDVGKSADILQPNTGIVTAIGWDHRTTFGGSQEAIAAEKAKLVYSLPSDGLAVLNADDPRVAAMAEGCRCRVVTFGHAEGSDLRILEASSNWPERLTFEVEYHGERFTVKSRLIGVPWILSVSAALLAALELGADRLDCLSVIEAQEPLFNRMSAHQTTNGAWYILDAEKAPYFAIEACLSFLETASAPRKTVVFGLISDYPGSSRAHYQRVARMALDRADRVIFTGAQAARVRRLAAGELAGRLFWEEEPGKVLEKLSADALADEIIYLKASRATGLHRLFIPGR